MGIEKKIRHALTAACLFALIGCASLPSSSADSCEKAYKRQDYKTAYRSCLPLAKQGDIEAQFYLGRMYNRGWGVVKNYTEAASWYRGPAEKGHAEAQFYLGQIYGHGLDMPVSHTKALRWYHKAAEQDHKMAQFFLGMTYRDGLGVQKNNIKAYKWLSLSSAQPNRIPALTLSELEAKMTPIQIAKGRKLAEDWLKQRR